MEAFLIEHELANRPAILVGLLACMAAPESLLYRRRQPWLREPRWIKELGLPAIDSLLLRLRLSDGGSGHGRRDRSARLGTVERRRGAQRLAVLVSSPVLNLSKSCSPCESSSA